MVSSGGELIWKFSSQFLIEFDRSILSDDVWHLISTIGIFAYSLVLHFNKRKHDGDLALDRIFSNQPPILTFDLKFWQRLNQ